MQHGGNPKHGMYPSYTEGVGIGCTRHGAWWC